MAIVVTMFEIRLPFGNPNFSSTPVTLAAVFLPWPVGVITGIIFNASASVVIIQLTGKRIEKRSADIEG